MAAYDLDPTIDQYEFVRQILNIYLYGDVTRPEYFGDHIRDVRAPSIVNFDIQKFMSEGPGKYIKLR